MSERGGRRRRRVDLEEREEEEAVTEVEIPVELTIEDIFAQAVPPDLAKNIIDLETLTCFNYDECVHTFANIIERFRSAKRKIDPRAFSYLRRRLERNILVALQDFILTPFEKYRLARSIACTTFTMLLVSLYSSSFRNLLTAVSILSVSSSLYKDNTWKVASIICQLFTHPDESPDVWFNRVVSLSETILDLLYGAVALSGLEEET